MCSVELEHDFEWTHSDLLAAQRLQQKLTGMDSEFKRYHLAMLTSGKRKIWKPNKLHCMNTTTGLLHVADLFDRLGLLVTPEEREVMTFTRIDPQQYRRLYSM